ncbi:MAG: hypothetical protein JNM56_02190 [Planctomycetia bacterium]|nr:hypothetical protein [Planctomycetia bacterium]
MDPTAITAQPTPPPYDSPLPEYRASTSTADLVIAGLLALVHAVLASPLLVYLLVFVPRYQRIFADFGMALPVLTVAVLNVADMLATLWFLAPVLLVILFGADFGMQYLLHRRRPPRLLLWTWFVLGGLLPVVGFFLAMLAIQLPMLTLFDGLSK